MVHNNSTSTPTELLLLLAEKVAKIEEQLSVVFSSFAKNSFNSKEAALYLGISMSCLDKKCCNRQIKFSKIGKLRRFTLKNLNDYLFGNCIKTDAEIDDEAELILMRKNHGVNSKNRKS